MLIGGPRRLRRHTRPGGPVRPAPSVPSRNRLRLHALGPCEAISSRGLGLTAGFDRQPAHHNSTLPNCTSNADTRDACNWRTGVIRSARPGEPCLEHFESCAGISVTALSFACGQTKWPYHRSPHRNSTATAIRPMARPQLRGWDRPSGTLASLVSSNLKLSQSENPVCFWISDRRSDSFE